MHEYKTRLYNSIIRFLAELTLSQSIKMTKLSSKVLSAALYRCKKTLEAQHALGLSLKNRSGVEEAKSAYKDALSKEISLHKEKTIPIFQSGTIHGESPVIDNYTLAKYFAVPGTWTRGANPNGYALYAYYDNESNGTFDPYTYALGIYTNYTDLDGVQDLFGGEDAVDLRITSSGFGSTGSYDGLYLSSNENEGDTIYDQQELQLIASSIGIDQTKYSVFMQNQINSLMDLKYNGSITQLIGSQNIRLTNTSTNVNVNTFSFVTDFTNDSYFWIWILLLALFLVLMVIYFDLWFPVPSALPSAPVAKPTAKPEGLFHTKK
jgi:hypothetical protein